MTTHSNQKALATKKRKSEQFAKQTITVDENWRIVRADQLNWEVQHRDQEGTWRFFGYYGLLPDAFRALPAKMLGEGAANDVASLISRQNGILESITKALNVKLT